MQLVRRRLFPRLRSLRCRLLHPRLLLPGSSARSQRRGNEQCRLRNERSRHPRRRSLDLVLNRPRAVRQRREQRRLPGSGISNCASRERSRLRARHQGVQGAPDQVDQCGKMESGEVCAAADDTGGSNMLLDLEVGRRVRRVEPVSPVICAESRSTGLGRAGPGKCGAHGYHPGSGSIRLIVVCIRLIVGLSASRAHRGR